MKDLYCAYDKDRLCDDICSAYLTDQVAIFYGARWDPSLPVPQYDYTKERVVEGPVCARGQGHAIQKRCKPRKED